jgi:protease-4
MRRATILVLLTFVPLGCFRPIRLLSNNQHSLEPFKAHLVMEADAPPPTRTGERVVAMPLEGGPAELCTPKVALIDVDGLLLNQNMTGIGSVGDNPVSLFQEKLEAAAAEPGVCAVVLRINSPGGAVNSSEVMFHELQRFRARTKLPVVACALDTAAGGGYLLAAGCDRVLVQPTSVVGGVGVIWNGYNLRETLGLQSIVAQTIKAGPNIDMGSTLRLYSESVRNMLEGMASDYHQHFKGLVRQLRPQIPAQCMLYGEKDADPLDGRVFTGIQAVHCGLADQLGFLDDAVARARQLAGQPEARLLLFRRPDDPGFSTYSVTPNTPVQNTAIPLSVPGLDRTRLPTFLFMWLPEPTVERLSGR